MGKGLVRSSRDQSFERDQQAHQGEAPQRLLDLRRRRTLHYPGQQEARTKLREPHRRKDKQTVMEGNMQQETLVRLSCRRTSPTHRLSHQGKSTSAGDIDCPRGEKIKIKDCQEHH